MRHTLFIFIVIALGLFGCKTKEKVSSPDEIGSQVMGILEDMNDLSKPEFMEYFISRNTLHEIAKNKKLVPDKDQRRDLLATTKKAMKVRYNFMRRRLKSGGKRYGINWERIKFASFDHKVETRGGAKFCYGKLIFTYNKRRYSVETSSIYDGSDYILVSVTNLSRANSE